MLICLSLSITYLLLLLLSLPPDFTYFNWDQSVPDSPFCPMLICLVPFSKRSFSSNSSPSYSQSSILPMISPVHPYLNWGKSVPDFCHTIRCSFVLHPFHNLPSHLSSFLQSLIFPTFFPVPPYLNWDLSVPDSPYSPMLICRAPFS